MESESELVSCMNGLKVEMAGFRAEMKEFKTSITAQVDSLGVRQTACQVNPSSCATARRLDEHIRRDDGKIGKITGIAACVISVLGFLFTLIERLG